MVPKPPPRESPPGFLYIPPFRVQGRSVAGETSCVHVPELDVCFDMGECLRPALSARYVAISHGHMDHVGGLAYYCSQRRFLGMGTGEIVCDARLASAIHRMMAGYVELEQQRTPYALHALEPEQQIEIKPHVFLRAFPTEHTAPSLGYAVIEHRSKLKPEFADYPQEKLLELKARGVAITRTLEVPLVAYMGDTAPGLHLLREDVRRAQIVICECTFFEPQHRERARAGMHMHVEDVAEWLRFLEGQALILTHVSRRTALGYARQRLTELAGEERASRVFLLMDHKFNRQRYERQLAEARAASAAKSPDGPTTSEPAPEAEGESG